MYWFARAAVDGNGAAVIRRPRATDSPLVFSTIELALHWLAAEVCAPGA